MPAALPDPTPRPGPASLPDDAAGGPRAGTAIPVRVCAYTEVAGRYLRGVAGERALRPGCVVATSVSVADTAREVLEAVAHDGCDVVVMTPSASAPALVRAIAAARPHVVTLGVVPPTADAGRAVLDLGRAGAHGIALAGPSRPLAAAQDAVARVAMGRLAAALTRELALLVPGPAVDVVRAAIARGVTADGVEGTAPGVARRASSRRLRAAGCPPPHRLLVWARLLMSSAFLPDGRVGLDDVARDLGFGRARTLRAHLRRESALRPGDLRECRASARLAHALVRTWHGRAR